VHLRAEGRPPLGAGSNVVDVPVDERALRLVAWSRREAPGR
jgi:hypothetical protein